jgi:phospholipid/cholesterol/gamma-HCH transport system substrate-binding protein
MTRRVRIQLALFVVVALVGIAYIGATYVRLPQLLGIGVYKVDLEMPATGGIFPNAEVTYRGAPAGRVGDIDLTPDGVVAHLIMDSSAPQIPDHVKAVVADRTAIGEQFIDLQPDRDSGPYLHNGSVIKTSVLPLPVDDLIDSVDTFARSVPLDELRTTVAELGAAFNGQGNNLQTIVTSLDELIQTWHNNLPQSIALIHDGKIVLDTQAAQSTDIRQFSTGLDELAAQLQASNPDLNRLITNGTPASDQIGALVRDSGPGLTTDLTNLRVLATAIAPQTWALQPLLQQLPALSLGTSSTAPGDGTTHFGLVLETNSPPPCTLGYEGTQRILTQLKARNPDFDDTRDDFPFNTNATCAAPQGSVSDVRGAARADLADPAVTQPWDGKPKTMPDVLDLNPVATQIANLIGAHRR